MDLAKTLKIPPNDNIRSVLKAVLEVIQHKFTTESLQASTRTQDVNNNTPSVVDLSQFPLGFDTKGNNDRVINL